MNSQQQYAYNACVNRTEHIFCTGAGGTGKSWVLSEVVKELQLRQQDKSGRVTVTSSTGISALAIGGITLHRFAGTQTVEDDLNLMIERVSRNATARNNWLETDILVIDEISMVSGTFFNNLSAVASNIRDDARPFGGIRVIAFGDFLQLPPISKGAKVYDTSAWAEMKFKCYELMSIVRQEDQIFRQILGKIRLGDHGFVVSEYMEKLERDISTSSSSVQPVNLFAHRSSADEHNTKRLDELTPRPRTYMSFDTGDPKSLNGCIAPRKLILKVGAQVMFTRNGQDGIVNGTVGTVTGFRQAKSDSKLLPVVSTTTPQAGNISIVPGYENWECNGVGGKTIATRRQLPLILAWAMTIHKSQGQTIPFLKVDLSGTFECGHTYVALSRAVSPEKLQVVGFESTKVRTDRRAVLFYEHMQTARDIADLDPMEPRCEVEGIEVILPPERVLPPPVRCLDPSDPDAETPLSLPVRQSAVRVAKKVYVGFAD